MKFYLSYILLFCFSVSINAQNIEKTSKHKVGIHTTFIGGNDSFACEEDGDASIDGKGFYTLGASYTFILSKRIELQSGLEFSRSKIRITPPYMGEKYNHSSWNENIKLLTIPLTTNINLGKYIFLNAGFLLDFEVSKNNSVNKQSGLGTVLGIGGKYDFDSGLSIFVNPYHKMHVWIPFPLSSYHQRFSEYGLKIGANYRF
ncbi:outer membrane beta-barrel protein [Dysgonomonas sp. Marseille-P4361]|uniref:outer membrane beta-barrel protein n=1 Tax=Dysgonomonas sp. Marseille-P4361 TaxID=2161820 RepID=UPI000D54BBA8|nr:outer membrane beta-barrel protein [Dysgonomonas sp. Marseille-P4361]